MFRAEVTEFSGRPWQEKGFLFSLLSPGLLWVPLKVKVTLRPTISQSVTPTWCPNPSGAHDKTAITIAQLRVGFCRCAAPSLTRGKAGSHSTSYPIYRGGSFPRGNRPECEADYSPLPSVETYLFIYGLINNNVSSSGCVVLIDWMIVHNESKRMLKEAGVAWLKVLSRYYPKTK
jgi:hypothetical protein